MNLRNYQQKCIGIITKRYSIGECRQLICMPTASGKTVVFVHLIKELNCRALIIVPTLQLMLQAKDKLAMIAPEISAGLVDGSHKEFSQQVIIASVQSACIESTLEQLKDQNFPLLIWDEAHHAAADGAREVIERLGFGKGTNKLFVGFTATPFREDGKGLGEIFDVVAFELTTKQMIDEGFLCPPIGYKIATDIDLSKVKTVNGDFQASSLSQVLDTPEMNDLVVKTYIEKAPGRPTICFGTSIQHAKNLSDGFTAYGIKSRSIDSTMSTKEREEAIAASESGEIAVLCNASLLTEGVDMPWISCLIIARPTRSRGLYTQMVGRGLRLWPNKRECVVLDFSDHSHNICNAAILLEDAIEDNATVKQTKKDISSELPANLNPKLKAAIVNHDPLGQSFTWSRGKDKEYVMRGTGQARLEIQQYGYEKYRVMFFNEQEKITKIADSLNFEWAFSSAEDFARDNRKLFVLADKNAEWRDLPITDKQREHLKKYRYKAGIDLLTRGQAAEIISSGVLYGSRR